MTLLEDVFNHLVLPPRVPGEQDSDLENISYEILTRFLTATDDAATKLIKTPWAEAFRALRTSLLACLNLNSGGLESSIMMAYFKKIQPNDMLILHVVQQNAAVLIRREACDDGDCVVFEAFEASAISERVLAASHTLEWDFPGRSARLPLAVFKDTEFQQSLAAFLEQASIESLYNLQASTRKAKVSVIETRDTTDPALITQMLIPLLEAMGDYFEPPLLRKRVRDEVHILKAELPWRRLPFWLVLRVAAQRQLSLRLGNIRGRISYKFVISLLLAGLLKECAGSLNPELTIMLRAKLCRRMAKLETEKTGMTSQDAVACQPLFDQLGPIIHSTIQEATSQVENAWKSFKRATTRHIHTLPHLVPESALKLSLTNSGQYLDHLLSHRPSQQPGISSFDLPRPLDTAVQQAQAFTDGAFRLASNEERANLDEQPGQGTTRLFEDRCTFIATRIDAMLTEIKDTYSGDPEQMSVFILSIFTLWTHLDQCAVAVCPLLREYRPVFGPDLLDVLQLPTMSQMRRLQRIQIYLSRRQSESRYGGIFDDIDRNCLATRYATQSTEMRSLESRIQSASNYARNNKEEEWERACGEYDTHTTGISENVCRCSWRDGQRNVAGCKRCWHWRVRNRLKIQVHEDFLPSSAPARAAVVFELAIPAYLSAYRDASWQILRTLAYPDRPIGCKTPEIELRNSAGLRSYMSAEVKGVSFASRIKTFHQTHYKFNSGKVRLSCLLLPLAAEYELYDHTSQLWVKNLKNPLTLQRLCGIQVPRELQTTILPEAKHPPPIVDGPSSYQAQANQCLCPSDMSIHEFSAYQKLLAGKVRRWPNILVEMGSSNLNFSNEEATRVMCQLAVQAGPRLPDEPLRAAHVIFKEPAFVHRLVEVIERRLHTILDNWREHHYMDLLITLIIRLFELSSGVSRDRARTLLGKARKATQDWTISLRRDLRTTTDAGAAQRIATYGFCAALLCRRTFGIYAELEEAINAEDFVTWVVASVALQENMLGSIAKLPQNLKRMLLRDAKMAYHLKTPLKTAVAHHPASVGAGISRWWAGSDNTTRAFSQWQFLAAPNERWIVATSSGGQGYYRFSQVVHHNVVEGHLLLNGKPCGKLPLEILDSSAVKKLFENQHLLTYPSPLSGMSYCLAYFEEQEVHFGVRDKQVIIRALGWDNELLEFVPMERFRGPDDFDLPSELIDNCAHWLNLRTGNLDVRRAPNFWGSRPRNWSINVRERQATRGGEPSVRLVDPKSDVFLQVAKVLEHIERPERITVFQPPKGKLAVHLPLLELSFYVTYHGLLYCRQLHAEVDLDQDAGTWYGLRSKLVLRDEFTRKRSIIVPSGDTTWVRHGMHVYVHIEKAYGYERYKIDDILGRLSCPPEPRLVYLKALYHALTSFCLPDPLTRRTGTEESFLILRSGSAQPWTPLGCQAYRILNILERLAPRREYYPPEIKRLQTVSWDDELSTTIQHDGYKALVRDITEKSRKIGVFSNASSDNYIVKEPTHLQRRGEAHQNLYRRPSTDTATESMPTTPYTPRDRRATSKALNVYEICRLILTGCESLTMQTNLRSILESSEVVGGFHDETHSTASIEPLVNQIEEPISEQWGSLVNRCRFAEHTTPLLFRLGLLAFNPEADLDAIRPLAAFAVVDRLKSLQPPQHDCFENFKSREKPSLDLLQKLITPVYPEFRSASYRAGTIRDQAGRNAREHELRCAEENMQLAAHFSSQWPHPADCLSVEGLPLEVLDPLSALQEIQHEWERRRKNRELGIYVQKTQKILDSLRGLWYGSALIEWRLSTPEFGAQKHARPIPSIALDLVTKRGPILNTPDSSCPFRDTNTTTMPNVKRSTPEATELGIIVSNFAKTSDQMRQQYAGDLLESLESLKDMSQSADGKVSTPHVGVLKRALGQAGETATSYFDKISSSIASSDPRSKWLQLGALWPCTSPVEVLTLLRSSAAHRFGPSMKEALVNYGLAVTILQRLERITHIAQREQITAHWEQNNPQQDQRLLAEELRNPGHENWAPLEVPDWLLIEIDGNFLIRAEQVDVARAIIAPRSMQNSVLQMNMGKGKTSCIMPMVVSVLANGNNLARLVVPKALLMQTAQTAQSRLGDLVGREVRHIPFSRKLPTTPEMLQLYEDLHRETRGLRGLILTSHENLLSYKLGGWQHLADKKVEAASQMIGFQRWLEGHCRDVLDECDFTLSVKTQLNYPSGRETTVDGHPFRWHVAQELLSLVVDHIADLRRTFRGIEVLRRPGSFPIVHILNSEVEDFAHSLILDDICAGRMMLLRPADLSFYDQQETIRRILSEKKFDERSFQQAAKAFANPQAAYKIFLVIRGLLVDRILFLCLSKRWNVQYGLHPGRHPVAVPFEAKGVPSEQSEFGHPDVAILFTCLSFYYSGLTREQFRQGLKQVLESDDPSARYEEWISGSINLPESLHHWNVINRDDSGQIERLWEHLKLDRVVINHYLNHFVFPVHAKQFEVKLQASAWDIPLHSHEKQHTAKTTGFSGTNDNRSMLPLTIKQDDLPSLRQTSAEVLSYLLQERNRGYEVTANSAGKRLTEEDLLCELGRSRIRILIDAGAYILEMDNRSLAQAWLRKDGDAKAAVYFGSDNRAMVHYRNVAVKEDVPLLTTPFVDDLSKCVVYLDQAHTRGVDMKFPTDAHAAVTLALKQTKDYTMQAAMRLRQLGTTQRVTFFAPPEVDQGIRKFCGIYNGLPNSSHVISWLLEQTCLVNEDLRGLYTAQGVDFCRRIDAECQHPDFLTDGRDRDRLLKVLRQPEYQTLDQLYGGESTGSSASPSGHMVSPQLQAFVNELGARSGHDGVTIGALEEVEQEREVQQIQVEQVIQVQKQLRFEALSFPGLHPTILEFVATGTLKRAKATVEGYGFEHAFAYVAKTNVGKQFGVRETKSTMFVSAEFGKTIRHTRNTENGADNFLRPVEWILWSPTTQTGLVIIPEEAELLIPKIRLAGDRSRVHLIAYAAPVTKGMLPFNQLQYYSLPPLPSEHRFPDWFLFDVGIIGGRLYVDLGDWDALAQYLRSSSSSSSDAADQLTARYGRIRLVDQGGADDPTSFADEPTMFLLEWLTLLRKTQDVLQTPIGYICTGRALGEHHPFRQSLS
ncbi:hypothetical protein GGS23DRAFT_548787 [Durotheca rogersii]|uniref:uncharacterized protein n=1 Tax=Durotheca rogersii TaxID=419775 RepID=UPI00221E760A|nr:uncharacterized protein GGS23DRAFT_548787 [Durotheca rogersii]KAI5867544.1 hypothetical protein GGS23DRAFT_548787 [Durotheca rogersii]